VIADGRCAECDGPLLWAGMSWEQHTEALHRVKRKVYMRLVARYLTEEVNFREMALVDGLDNRVLVIWRIVLPTHVHYAHSTVPGQAWDELDREQLLAWLGRGIRDELHSRAGIRVHHMRVKYRVFDERT